MTEPTGDPAMDRAPGSVPLLEMRGIRKTFGGNQALKDVSFAAYGGEIHALMGENGAGKSTLMKILSGAYRADPGGEIRVRAQPVVIGDPMTARRLGISVIYQELSLAPNLTVAENIFLGTEPSRGILIDRRAMENASEPLLRKLGADFSARTRVSALSLGQRQLVEIARALQSRSRILVMDEPTTSLTSRETEQLFTIVRQLKAEGIAVIYISHRMEEVYELADRVSVLRDGVLVGTLVRSELSAARLVRMMVGRDLSSFYRKEHTAPRQDRRKILSARGFADGRRVHDCSFDLFQGEVLGFAGLVGAGRTELARLIYGADPARSGELELEGRPLRPQKPREAIDAGIVYLTEDRKALGLFLNLSIGENVNIAVAGQDALPGGFTNFKTGRARASHAMSSLSIRAADAAVNTGELSGGNQQKVLLARLLEVKPKVLILDEPTRGVDIGAKSDIYRLIDALAREGVGVIVISSDLPEVAGICDRVIVIRNGRVAAEVAAQADMAAMQEEIMTHATGAAGTGHAAHASHASHERVAP
jgi:ribose transport system ATP-binding protein